MTITPADDSPEYLIIGPMASGKTSLLAVLETAADAASEGAPGKYAVFPEGKEMEKLFAAAATMSEVGRFDLPPTKDVTTYQFILRVAAPQPAAQRGGFPRPPALPRQYRFRMMDGPGEALFGVSGAGDSGDLEAGNENRAKLVELGRKSKGLILCLDVSDLNSGRAFFNFLLPVFREMATNHVVPFERVALVLTKSDKFFAEHGRDAEGKAMTADPWERAEHLLGAIGIRRLLKCIDPAAHTGVYCGWASVYGFVPGQGTANYDEEEDTLLEYSEGDPLFWQRWRPFRILDPFVYVATGDALGLHRLPDKWLPR